MRWVPTTSFQSAEEEKVRRVSILNEIRTHNGVRFNEELIEPNADIEYRDPVAKIVSLVYSEDAAILLSHKELPKRGQRDSLLRHQIS
jgi:hypothetical protein